MGLDRYKWYQSQTLENVPVRRLSPKGKGGCTRSGVPARMLGPEGGRFGRKELAGPEGGWAWAVTNGIRSQSPDDVLARRISPKGRWTRGGVPARMLGLNRYKWYQSQTLDDVLAKRLSPEGGWTRGGVPARMLAPKGVDLGGSTSIGERNSLAPKGVDCEIPHRLGRETKHSL